MTENQNPEQKARDNIDAQLKLAGWVIQSAKKIDFSAGPGIAVREYQTDVGPADYVLFIDKKAVGVIEAKKEELGHKITEVEEQTEGYATAKLKWVSNSQPLPFLYESTGVITRFTDVRDPKPPSREVFGFHRPETFKEWINQRVSLRGRLQQVPLLNPDHLPAKKIAPARLPGNRHRQPRRILQGRPPLGVDPNGHRCRQNLYRLHLDLPAAQARQRQARALAGDTKNLGEQA